MIIIPAKTRGNEWNPSLDTLVEEIERLLQANPARTDEQIANAVYNANLEVVPVTAISQIREALKKGAHPVCGFSHENDWFAWANQHGIEVARQ